MACFAMPYRILFHDTMAYGSQHHMVNLKLQNVARETVLFDSQIDGRETWRDELADIVILTREAYSLNLAQAGLGEKVAVLMTYENPTRSTVRLCFRIVHGNGQPVSCGYQTMILAHRVSGALVPPPPMLAQYLDRDREGHLLEPLTEPSFADRAKTGGAAVKTIMSPEICALGARVAAASRDEGYPKVISLPASLEGGAPSPQGAAAFAGAGS